MGPEQKLYHKLKKSIPEISWIRLENLSLLGTPDLLASNTSGSFFTVELKVTKANKVRFSPHQIAFHVKHPHNTFIIVDPLGPRSLKHVHMYRGSRILDLVEQGLKLDACSLGLDACRLMLNQVGSKAS